MCPGVGLEGSLGWSAQPLGGAVYRVHASTLLLLSFGLLLSHLDNVTCVGTR